MFGWLSAARIWASRRKRASRSGSVANRQARQDLQGDVAIELGIVSTVDLAHPARAKRAHDFIGTDARARRPTP